MENYIVVKELKQKRGSNNDYSAPVKFSTEQRFIPAMLNSNNNNLEEQNILGTDCVTIDWEEDNEKKQLKNIMMVVAVHMDTIFYLKLLI